MNYAFKMMAVVLALGGVGVGLCCCLREERGKQDENAVRK